MDLFDIPQLIELLKAEPGHGFVQSFLLFMILLSSRGVKKEVIDMKNSFLEHKIKTELRLTALEPKDSNEHSHNPLYPERHSAST